jgi:hypothetical protein
MNLPSFLLFLILFFLSLLPKVTIFLIPAFLYPLFHSLSLSFHFPIRFTSFSPSCPSIIPIFPWHCIVYIFNYLPSTMRQHQVLKLSPYNLRPKENIDKMLIEFNIQQIGIQFTIEK